MPLIYTVKAIFDANGDGVMELLVKSEYYQ